MSVDRTRPLRMEYRAFLAMTTRWADNDCYGHMNNVVHYALFDSAVNQWLVEQTNFDFQLSESIGLVVESGCRYFSEMAYPDRIAAGLRVSRIGNSSVTYEIALFRNDEQEASAAGFFTHVYVDRHTRRPFPLTEKWRGELSNLLC